MTSRTTSPAAIEAVTAHRAEQGFTLLEIMMAVGVLVIGILGVLALFPVALRSGKLSIETTNAAIIAQSVEQAIRDGIQTRRYQTEDGKFSYFILQHSGVTQFRGRPDPNENYYILLPDRVSESASPIDRDGEYRSGKTFVYPETDGTEWEEGGVEYEDYDSGASPNGLGNVAQADDDGDDYEESVVIDGEEILLLRPEVLRTYRLDEDFFDWDREDSSAVIVTGGGERGEITTVFDQEDPIETYSFAFTIRRAWADSSLGRQLPDEPSFVPASQLYEVEILVYRGFIPRTKSAFEPIYRSKILVSK